MMHILAFYLNLLFIFHLLSLAEKSGVGFVETARDVQAEHEGTVCQAFDAQSQRLGQFEVLH